jgi:hypothetical protein
MEDDLGIEALNSKKEKLFIIYIIILYNIYLK